MEKKEQEKVWWTVPSSAYVKLIDIKPYFSDVDLENDRLEDMANMERSLGSYEPYPDQFVPDELRWYQSSVSEKDRNLPDFFKGHSFAPIISEAMYDVLSEFDLGSSQFFECPLYEIKASNKLGRTEADRSKLDPRRWFLFHLSVVKSVLNLEQSSNLSENPYQPGFYSPSEDTVIAINAEQAANGPPIWRDPSLVSVYFFTDAAKRKIMAKGLRTPSLRFKPCLLV
jgi:hypothetical protein